jgi:uncharacterized OB-fold protein
MNANPGPPRPYEDEDNAAFLAAWGEGKILLQRSRTGGPAFLYPRPICPFTGSRDLVTVLSSGRGRIVSFSLVLRPNHASFNDEVPIVLAEIVLDEGASLLARVVGCDPDSVRSGLAVEALPLPEAAKYPLPTFHLASGAATP